MNIDELRKEIDSIDAELTSLLEKRMCVSTAIGEYKKQNGLKVYDAAREREVIAKNLLRLKDKALAPYVENIYNSIMGESKKKQSDLSKKELSIGFQGVKGSFSHEACLKYTSANNDIKYTTESFNTFDNLCNALLNGDIDRAVIPFENSSTGPVVDVYDLLSKYNFYIVGEVYVKVNHNLMVKEGTDIANVCDVYSHPQAFMQCKEFLNQHNYKQIPHFNTAMSAEFVSKSLRDDIAAIASETAAKLYSLKIVEHDINYNANNVTKFIILSNEPREKEDSNKISIIVSIEDRAGSLADFIGLFKGTGINMTKIESRPDIGSPFKYIFFIDFSGNVLDNNVSDFIEKLKEQSNEFKYLGNYRAY